MNPREINLPEAIEMVSNFGGAVADEVAEIVKNWSGPFLVYDGDVKIDGELAVGPGPVIVWGSLEVDGAVIDRQGASRTLLVVLGDLRCKNLITLSQVCVLGDVDVSGVIFGEAADGNDRMIVSGTTRAKAIVNDAHWFHLSGQVDADFVYGHVDGAPTSGFRAEELFISEVLDGEEEELDESIYASTIRSDLIVQRLRQGQDILRDSPSTRRHELMSSLSEVSETKRVISLEDAGLFEVPDEVFDTPGLARLTLDFNEITSLPARIGELTDLRFLSLDNTQIRRLPPEIAKLQELRTLSLRFMRIKQLPDEIAQLKNLSKIFLTYSAFDEFPEPLRGLPNLVEVQFWHCEPDNPAKLEQMIESLKTLPSLTTLGFYKGEISRFPTAISELENLESLELTEIRIGDDAMNRLLASLPNVRVKKST